MAESDDIEKLLREIDAMNAGSAQAKPLPAPAQGKAVEAAPGAKAQGGGRAAWAGTSAIGGLFVGGFVGTVLTFLPYVSTASTALGAALGAAAAGAISGPPGWFRRG